MAYDAFLTFDPGDAVKVEGETSDSVYGPKKAIAIYSFSWGLSNPSTGGHGGGMSAGKVSVGPLSIMKRVDTASAALASLCSTGGHQSKATLTVRKAGGKVGQVEYLVYTLGEIFVESYQISGSSGGDDYPTESVTLACGQISFDYKMQKTDGTLDAAKHFGWDQTTNKPI